MLSNASDESLWKVSFEEAYKNEQRHTPRCHENRRGNNCCTVRRKFEVDNSVWSRHQHSANLPQKQNKQYPEQELASTVNDIYLIIREVDILAMNRTRTPCNKDKLHGKNGRHHYDSLNSGPCFAFMPWELYASRAAGSDRHEYPIDCKSINKEPLLS